MCNNCKKEITVTDVEADAKIWVDSKLCDCVGGDVDCGYDDRNCSHSHIWMDPKDVAVYCKELQEAIKVLKQGFVHETRTPKPKARITCPKCHATRIIPRDIAHMTHDRSQCACGRFGRPIIEDIDE